MDVLGEVTITPEMGGAKLARAREHFNMLYSELINLFHLHAQTPIIQRDENAETLTVQIPEHEIPTKINLIIGDCIQNYRISLDHAIHELARRSKGDNWSGLSSTEFPIMDTPAAYQKQSGTKIGALSKSYQTFIHSIQPFQIGTGNAAKLDPTRLGLTLLHRLSRVDKHRRILITGITVSGLTLEVRRSDGSELLPIAEISPPMRTMYAVRYEPAPASDRDLNIRFSTKFLQEPAEGRGVIVVLREVDEAVTTVLTELDRS